MQRRNIAISGTVQGVGFRPFVFGLASRLRLAGFVRNDGGGVRIEVEGDGSLLDQFLKELVACAPPLAHVDQVLCDPCPVRGEREFRIESSHDDAGSPVVISADVATCDACLAELFDPADRRYRYPFLNCTNCGPRLTIVTGAPYDRLRTTMARFPMCPACRAEYDDPTNRRFHAQPTACADCGPMLAAADARGQPVDVADPVRWFAEALRGGRIGALKGLGGYHLTCDAGDARAVDELRRRKRREEKPFAVMVGDLAAAEALCEVSDEERRLLTSPRRPIVLLRRRRGGDAIVPDVAPGNPELGVMLPYTPLHHLLLHEMCGRPLVMTSGNRSDEPIAIDEPDVFERLAGIADLFLTHNRPIHVRCDDSVIRAAERAESPVRRSRGYAPQPVAMPVRAASAGLAVGGQLKATFGLLREDRAILSHHLGGLDHFEAYRAFERDVDLYERTFGIHPAWIAHDLHPDYASTRYARRRAEAEGIPAIAVQHHHAHMASCMAEHGLAGPVIGVCFDGTGYGTDGAIWGGEFLVGDLRTFRRAGHLRYVSLPGGERAVREPWRMALAHMEDAEAELPALLERFDAAAARTVRRMIERRFNAPPTSSAGRLFDAVASLIGLRDRVSFEGQAAMQLEWLAAGLPVDGSYPFEIVDSAREGGATDLEAALVIDTRPLVRAVVEDVRRNASPGLIARRFHTTLVELIVEICKRLGAQTGLSQIVLSGGVFMNSLLTGEAQKSLQASGFSTLRHRRVPPNDGGLSLGQLAVAAARTGGAGESADKT